MPRSRSSAVSTRTIDSRSRTPMRAAATNGQPARVPARRGRPANGPDKQAEIFATALRIFRQKGYHAASMQDLADAVGLQKASLYHYISSKEDLMLAIYERATGAFTAQLTELAATSLPPTEKLERAIESHLVALCDQLELFTVYLREQNFFSGRQRARVRAEGEHHAQLLEAILEEGVRSGEFRALNVKMTAHAILGMCNWIYQWYSPEGKLTPRAIAAIFSELVIKGLNAAPDKKRAKRATRRGKHPR